MEIEICIEARSANTVSESVGAARAGGAHRVELCSGMNVGGLTPEDYLIRAASELWESDVGLNVMIRPRGGWFDYSAAEVALMEKSIRIAADNGAHGVVFGAVENGCLMLRETSLLTGIAKKLGLLVTFHRAFDAITNVEPAIELIRKMDIDRVLTAGIPWEGIATHSDRIKTLAKTIRLTAGSFEIIVAGGITAENVGDLLSNLPGGKQNVSVHAYSGVKEDNRVDSGRVNKLVAAVQVSISRKIGNA